jgi:hypothetical protein
MPERFTETMRAASKAGWSHAVQHRFVNEVYQFELNLTVVVGFRSEARGRGAVLTRSWDRDPPSRRDGDHDI